MLHEKCESNKSTVKAMGLACVVLRNIYIEKGDLLPRKLDLTFGDAINKRRNSEEVWDLLDVINTGSKNYLLNKAEAVKVGDSLKLEFRNS